MTVDEYRNRLKKSFEKCKCAEFIPLIAEPTDEGFDKLERFLINFYRNPNEHSTAMSIALGMVLMNSYKNNKAIVVEKNKAESEDKE